MSSFKQKVIEESKNLAVIAGYLFAATLALELYRDAVLAKYNFGWLRVGTYAIESLALAKVVLIGDLLHLGGRSKGAPLLLTVLYKTALFSVFALAFSILEHLFIGAVHGRSPATVLRDTINPEALPEVLSHVLMIVIVFVPMFAIWETGRALGSDKFRSLFLHKRATT